MAQDIDISNGEAALKGVVLCCTSLSQDVRVSWTSDPDLAVKVDNAALQDKLAHAAVQMGAIHKLDLTSDVTHLIVGSITTPKYRYVAKERPDIKVLHPDWIEAVRTRWMEAEDVDLEALEKEHRLPTFHGLQICVTGFDDLEQRESIRDNVIEQGAVYHGDLIKTVTHLVAAVPQGKKYSAAKSWDLNVVSLKWYDDSLSRGMALDESLYDPVMPLEEQGKGAFRLQPKRRTSLGKRGREGETGAPIETSKKKLRRTTSTRLESQSQDMWQDISAHSVVLEDSMVDQWTEKEDRSTAATAEELSAARQSIPTFPTAADDVVQGLFAGSYVLLRGFEATRRDRLQHFLEPNGAQIVQSPSELDDSSTKPFFRQRYLLVPHARPDVNLELPNVPELTLTVTEWWVERCIHYKRLLDPNEDVLSNPLWFDKVPAFEQMSIATTGFGDRGVELRQVAEAVKLLGARYQETIMPTSSVLVCASSSFRREKVYYAQKHKIPIVSADWLWMCLREGAKMPLKDFDMHLPALDLADIGGESSANTPAPSDLNQRERTEGRKKKDEQLSKRLSTTRTKQAKPSLSFQASKTNPSSVTKKPQPIVHEDEDDEPSIDSEILPAPTVDPSCRPVSQPLQELSPNLSPRKTSETAKGSENGNFMKEEASSTFRARSPARSEPPEPLEYIAKADEPAQVGSRRELDADIQALINRSASHRPSSASSMHRVQKRKTGRLGRAPSGISNRSASASNLSDHTSPALRADECADAVDGGFTIVREAPLPPSTQLGYETADAEAHRLQMSKKMGTKLEDDDGGLRRVANLGVVKDSATLSDAGVGNRTKARHRTK